MHGLIKNLCDIMRTILSFSRINVFLRLFLKSKLSDITGSCGLSAVTVMDSKEGGALLVTSVEVMKSQLSHDLTQVVSSTANEQADGRQTISKNALKRVSTVTCSDWEAEIGCY